MSEVKKIVSFAFAAILLLQVFILAPPKEVYAETIATVNVFRQKYNPDAATTNSEYVGLNGVTYTIYDISSYYNEESKKNTEKTIAENLKNLDEATVKSTIESATVSGMVVTQTITTSQYGLRDGVAQVSLPIAKTYLFVETSKLSNGEERSANVLVVLEADNISERYFFPKTYIPTTPIPKPPEASTTDSSTTGTTNTGTTTSSTAETTTSNTTTDTTSSTVTTTTDDGSLTTSSTSPPSDKLKGRLPDTGEMNHFLLIILGMLVISIMIMLKKLQGKE